MGNDYKLRVKMAMERHHAKLLPKKPRAKRNKNNEGPVVLAIKNYLESIGFNIDVIESKAVYNAQAGQYLSGKAKAGFSDLVGNTPDGISAYIEVKATGKRGTLKPHQRDFLISKISTNCFAICADSVEYTGRIYQEWLRSDNRKALLLHDLPTLAKRYQEDDLNFDD